MTEGDAPGCAYCMGTAMPTAKQVNDLLALLREADDMWAFSAANETRGHWDCQWNERRLDLLKEANR